MGSAPTIRGVECQPAPEDHISRGVMSDVLAPWLCPFCSSALSPRLICLNACHLSDGMRERVLESLQTLATKGKDNADY